MKYYVIVTGVVFGLISLAHFLRGYLEGSHLFKDPFFIFTTLLSITLCIWACLSLRRLGRVKS